MVALEFTLSVDCLYLLVPFAHDYLEIQADEHLVTRWTFPPYINMATGGDLHRLHTHDLEIGATEAVQKHYSRHVVATKPVSQRKLDFEHSR